MDGADCGPCECLVYPQRGRVISTTIQWTLIALVGICIKDEGGY
jgi:hypothetical protein